MNSLKNYSQPRIIGQQAIPEIPWKPSYPWKVHTSAFSTYGGIVAAGVDSVLEFTPSVLLNTNLTGDDAIEVGFSDSLVVDLTPNDPGMIEYLQFRNSFLGIQCKYNDNYVPYLHDLKRTKKSKVNWEYCRPITTIDRDELVADLGRVQLVTRGVSDTLDGYADDIQLGCKLASNFLLWLPTFDNPVTDIIVQCLFSFETMKITTSPMLHHGGFALFSNRRNAPELMMRPNHIAASPEDDITYLTVLEQLSEIENNRQIIQPNLSFRRQWRLPDFTAYLQ